MPEKNNNNLLTWRAPCSRCYSKCLVHVTPLTLTTILRVVVLQMQTQGHGELKEFPEVTQLVGGGAGT